MEWYLVLAIVAVAVSIAIYGIAGSLKNIPVTGLSVGWTENNSEPAGAEATNSSATEKEASVKPACPISCDDGNKCTSDYCNERTGYKCVSEPITGCCELGKVYCDGNCTITRCMVDRDCDDASSFTVDKCTNPNSCNAACTHTLVPNVCGNSVCESGENYSTCSKDCSFLAPAQNIPQNNTNQSKILRASITSDKNNYTSGENVTITIFVTDGLNPIYNAILNVSIKYPYPSTYVRYPVYPNKRVQNYTDNNGIFTWIFHSPSDKIGTFNASVIANKDGYDNGYNYTLFDVFNSTTS